MFNCVNKNVKKGIFFFYYVINIDLGIDKFMFFDCEG